MFTVPFYTNVTQKGQVTLPVELRTEAGIATRAKVAVSIRDDEIVIKPIKSIADFYGKYKLKKQPRNYNIDRVRDFMINNYA